MNLNRATKQDAVVRLADPFQVGAGRMVSSVTDEEEVTHRGMKQHRIAQGHRSKPGVPIALRPLLVRGRSTAGQCKKRRSDGELVSDGLRFSVEAANPRGVKRPTFDESCQAAMDTTRGVIYP